MERSLAEWFAGLAGSWTQEKTVSDGSRLSGSARFAPSESGYELHESGTLILPDGVVLSAGRIWLWDNPDGMALAIRFQDGRLYHRLGIAPDGAGWTGSATHCCGEDRYQGSYRFGLDRIEVRHRIAGPRKDYSIRSVLSRR